MNKQEGPSEYLFGEKKYELMLIRPKTGLSSETAELHLADSI